ncbi:MAG: arginine repressor [Clostridia bacterium]|nr:arginine repressor [Clostridia bacterium]
MTKAQRQKKILQIVENNAIETQEELLDELDKAGLKVTQATISRDVKELRLFKVMNTQKEYCYTNLGIPQFGEEFCKAIKNFVSKVTLVEHSIVLRVLHGTAEFVAGLIDKNNFVGVLGCLTGPETVMIVCDTKDKAKQVIKKFEA